MLLENDTGEKGVSNKLGVCDEVDKFDTAFFGIHRNQATYMDPMQRLILENTFEALVDAGVNPQEIRGKKVGVFTASSVGENDNLFYESIVSGFGVTGHSRAMMANRISYWLDLKGTSCAYDSNWIGGIEVLTLAADAIKDGRVESAIIGSSNLALNAELSWLYNDMGLLSADGSTKPFDKDASGYARADGTVVMYLQKARDAYRAYATIVHSSTVYDGCRDTPILGQSLEGMTEFLNKFYEHCKVDPGDVEYVEAYGSAVKETDEIELKAIESIYCKNRKKPLLIGALKPQTGHAEASDSLVTITKVILAMEAREIPATLQYKSPNPNIPGLLNGNLEVVVKNTPWKGELAAIHGIGITSSYGHVLLRSNPKIKIHEEDDDMPKLIIASGRTDNGIQKVLNAIQSDPNIDRDYIALTHNLFSKNVSGHLYRGYTILDKSDAPKQEFEHYPGNKRPIWFIFSGMGSQWIGMGKELMNLPIFAESIMKSHKILLPKGIDLLDIITTSDPHIFDSILNSFVGIAAVQIALTDILKALGVVPDGIVGHSVGELGCAYADGCLTAEQMIMCSYSRGKASLEVELIRGMMAAIGVGYNQAKDKIPASIEVACHNSKDNCTLSGPTEDMEAYVEQLQNQGVFAKLVNVSNIAYHSRYIKPAAPLLLKYLKEIIPNPKPRSSKWISTSAPEDKWHTDAAKLCSAVYHTNNLLGSVLFEEGCKYIPEDAIAIEVAPHGLLQAILKRSLKSGCTNIPLTQRGNKNPFQFLLTAIGKMYIAGVNVNLAAIYSPIEFPISRGTSTLAPLVDWEHSEKWRIGIEDKMNYLISIKDINVVLSSEEYKYCAGHELDDNCIFPLSAFLDIILEIESYLHQTSPEEIVIENLQIKNVLVIPKIGTAPLHATVQKGSGCFEILSGDTMLLCGRIFIPESTEKPRSEVSEIQMGDAIELTGKDIYSEFNHRKQKYGGEFKSIKSLTIGRNGQKSIVNCSNKWQMLLEALLQQFFFKGGEKYQNTLIPSFIHKIVVAFNKLPTNNEDVEVSYNYYTRIASCDSMQVIGLEYKNMIETIKPIHLDDIEFIPFVNNVSENMETIINNSVQIILSNFEDPSVKNIIITEIESSNESFAANVKNVSEKNMDINCNFHQTKENKAAIISARTPVLIIYNGIPSEFILKMISSTHAFGLIRSSEANRLTENQTVEIADFSLGNQRYSLIKKLSNEIHQIVRIKSDVVSTKDLTKETLPWIQELKSLTAAGKTVLLVCPIVPTEGVSNFVLTLRSMLPFRQVRCLFSLDRKIDIDQNTQLTKLILQKDLYISALKSGSYGSYIPTSIDLLPNIQRQQQSPNALISNKHLQYIGINADDETLTKETHEVGLGNVDYSGINDKGEVIVGLAKMDKDTCDLLPDPILHWTLPEYFTVQDGCTIPHAFVTAYYMLVVKAKLKSGETVLIHNGCSAIGLASISVALSYGCNVFTTVANDEQKAFILKRYNVIAERNVLSNQNSSFELYLLLATGGQGAHVIINTLSKSLLGCGIRCLGETGRFIQLGKFDVKEHYSIGMNVFLKNTSVETVIPEGIFDLPNETKQLLKDLVEKGIEDYYIRPMIRNVSREISIKSIVQKLISKDNIGKILVKVTPDMGINYLIAEKPHQFMCDPKASYVIYGGSAEAWTDIVEWLVFRGARQIVVTSECKVQQQNLNRRLNLLRRYYNAQIHHIPNKIQTKENASEYLSDIYKIGTINALFILPIKTTQVKQSDIKPIQYLDMALRNITPKTLFINLFSDAFGIGQNRADAEFPTYNIEWFNTVEFSDVLYALDDILAVKMKQTLIKSAKVSDIVQETTQILYKKLNLMLPASAEELLEQYESASEKPKFKQVLTLGPRRIREVPPIFVIPGLYSHNIVSDMCFELLHPTFVAELSNSAIPLKQIAKDLADQIVTIFPRGPYNIIALSWGGALAIEVVKLLQQRASTRMYIVDGAPHTINLSISHLGDPISIEVNVLSNLLNITSTETLRNMNNAPDLHSRLDIALRHKKCNKDDEKILKDALNLLIYRLECILSYKPSGELLSGDIFLIRPSGSSAYDECGLPKYASRKAKIRVVNGDHLTMLQNIDVPDIINENIMVRNK